MKTSHKLFFGDARNMMSSIASESVDLIVTSPPYPMIEMWDEIFSNLNSAVKTAIIAEQGMQAFELMHQELDKVWNEVFRVLKPGGIACVNIGDATRSIGGNFQLFSNHSRILSHFLKRGFSALPEILWRKQTNAPNKFMGSGMLPPGAYVTLEHEFILIFRKGSKREFSRAEEKAIRQNSSFFWEERNSWFSDIWEIKGTRQKMRGEEGRERSGAYPFELAYRLINMFSVKGDLVLDPFMGTGTTAIAAMVSNRNSIGIEIDHTFAKTIKARIQDVIKCANSHIEDRLTQHVSFVAERIKTKGPLKHKNSFYGFPVMTAQETELMLHELKEIVPMSDAVFEVIYSQHPQPAFCKEWMELIPELTVQSSTLSKPPMVTTQVKERLRVGESQQLLPIN